MQSKKPSPLLSKIMAKMPAVENGASKCVFCLASFNLFSYVRSGLRTRFSIVASDNISELCGVYSYFPSVRGIEGYSPVK